MWIKDPDPGDQKIPDPDPQHWFLQTKLKITILHGLRVESVDPDRVPQFYNFPRVFPKQPGMTGFPAKDEILEPFSVGNS